MTLGEGWGDVEQRWGGDGAVGVPRVGAFFERVLPLASSLLASKRASNPAQRVFARGVSAACVGGRYPVLGGGWGGGGRGWIGRRAYCVDARGRIHLIGEAVSDRAPLPGRGVRGGAEWRTFRSSRAPSGAAQACARAVLRGVISFWGVRCATKA